jgi:hypothetical protein
MSRDKAAQYASSLQRNISLYFPFLAYYQISYYKSKPQRSKDHFSHDRFVLVLLWLSGRNCLTPLRLADLCRLDFRWELQIGHFTEKDVMMRTYANFMELLRRPVCVFSSKRHVSLQGRAGGVFGRLLVWGAADFQSFGVNSLELSRSLAQWFFLSIT